MLTKFCSFDFNVSLVTDCDGDLSITKKQMNILVSRSMFLKKIPFSFPGEGANPSVVIFNAFLRFRFQNFPTTSIGSLKACVDWFIINVSMAGILTCFEHEVSHK